MRHAVAVLALLSVLGFGRAAASQKEAQGTTGKTGVLKVSGMSCSACAATVEKTAKTIDGVKAASASQPKGTAEIVYDPAKTTAEAIARIISEKTPFKAEVAKPDPRK